MPAKKGITLLALLIWTLAGMHCKLEKISGLEFLKCAADKAGAADCQGDGCEVVESGFCKAPKQAKVLPAPLLPDFSAPPLPLDLGWDLASARPHSPSDIPRFLALLEGPATRPRAPSPLS